MIGIGYVGIKPMEVLPLGWKDIYIFEVLVPNMTIIYKDQVPSGQWAQNEP